MKLCFENSQGIERVIAEVKDEQEAMNEIKKFCEERNFEIYYIRSWQTENYKVYDVGSWSEFFYLYNKTK